LVSQADKRLAIGNEDRAREAAHAALAALDVVRAEDLEALRMGDGLAAYLQSLLIRRGVLDTDGILREDQFPARAEDLVLEPDGSAQFGQIFDFLHDLYTAAAAEWTALAKPEARWTSWPEIGERTAIDVQERRRRRGSDDADAMSVAGADDTADGSAVEELDFVDTKSMILETAAAGEPDATTTGVGEAPI
jgi:hypothetical protein